MGRYRVETPDGQAFEIDGPDNATETQINEAVRGALGEKFQGNPILNKRAQGLKDARESLDGKGGYRDLIQQGATLGFSDEAAGAVNASVNLLRGDTDLGQSYRDGRDAERQRIEEARQNTGWTGTAAEFAGGLVGGLPKAGVAALLSTGQAARQGVRTGAGIGALAGFGNGDGLVGSTISAGAGSVLGGALGGAIPLLANVAATRLGGLSRFLGRDTDGLAQQIVGQSLAVDANTPAAAGAMVAASGERGVPFMIADTGENARGLLASVARRPGGARTLAREAVGQRQVEQGDRVVGAIGRDLGPVANVRQQSDRLMREADEASTPFYDEFRAGPGRSSPELESILSTPAGRQALGKAKTIAENDRVDPNKLGFDLNDQGEVTLVQNPSPETLDYVKRGLDDILEDARDPITRQINYTPSLRAVENVRKSLIREVDSLHPAYPQARAAFAGPASAEEALQLGRQSLTASAEDIEAAVRRMGQGEREQYALGFRAAMADNLGRAVDGADKVGRLLGTPRKRAALAQVFGGEENFGRFLQTMQDERATGETYRSLMTGSQTAERLAADAETSDNGIAETAMNVATRGGNTTAIGLFGDALKALREVDRFGAGEAGNRTRESVAALLTETDPAVLRELATSVNRALSRQRRTSRVINTTSSQLGIGTGANSGAVVGAFAPPQN